MKRLGFIRKGPIIKQKQNHKQLKPDTQIPRPDFVSPKRNNSEAKQGTGPGPKQNTHTKSTRFAIDTGLPPCRQIMHIETVLAPEPLAAGRLHSPE